MTPASVILPQERVRENAEQTISGFQDCATSVQFAGTDGI